MCLEDTVRIPLRARDGSVRAYALVDAADAAFAQRWTWRLNEGYAWRGQQIGGHFTHRYLHRELLGLARGDGLTGDHIDRDRLNCTRSNLRVVPKGAQSQNVSSRTGTSSSYRGVTWNKRERKWVAKIKFNGTTVHLGYFTDELEAAEAAKAARKRLLPYAVD